MKLKFPSFKPINAWLHLWLGLASGLVVVIVSITGCILAFEQEIKSITQPYLSIEQTAGKTFLPPSFLIPLAEKSLEGKKATGILYPGPDKSAIVSSFTRKPKRSFQQVFIDPYTGKVLAVKGDSEGPDFFRFILEGHFNLWLPRDIGQPIVSYATVIFVVLLITGIVLWWPKKWNKTNRDKSFKIKWSAKWKRVNYDLHNVPGFYAMVIALLIALTGMTFGLHWFTDGLYWGISGGKSKIKAESPLSDTTVLITNFVPKSKLDQIWWDELTVKPLEASISLNLPGKASDAISTTINYRPGTFYNTKTRYFDQYSGKEFTGKALFDGHAEEIRMQRQIHLYSYDIHVGGILGFPGKVLAFLASLVSASLPITGFIIWWGKKKKGKDKPKHPSSKKNKTIKQQEQLVKPKPVALRRVPSMTHIQSKTVS